MALTITIPGGAVQLQGTEMRVKINTDNVQGDLYRVLLKITSEDAKLDGMPQILENIPDANGDAWFDISGFLYRYFVPTFSATGGVLATERADIPALISLDIGESYVDANSVRQENWAGLDGDQYQVNVLQGGLSEFEKNLYTEQATNWYNQFIVGGKWLTALPSGVKIAPTAAAKLWCISAEAAAQNLTFKADYTLLDGTTGTVSQAITVNPGSIYEFNVDPATLGLDVASANPVASYQCYLENTGVQVIEKFTFNLDYTYYEFNTQVFAFNRYSAIDPYWFTGKVKTNFPAEHTTAQRTAQKTDTTRQRTVVISAKSGRRKWIVNTGHKSWEEIRDLEHLIMSRQLWILDETTGYVIPVNIENSAEALGAIDKNLHDFELELTEAHNNRY
ncbi:hypothetical protein [uncultured Draconibacterium sp.]|uniref:hypothetical protein n=1 Tax=uncultured Draconibacterium sp. TaxID=1573823 RepID=UPI0029C79B01|nr:hypothetical protein [uncultured Draconibacterium sp.]